MKKYIAYYRVSTSKQGVSGLGIEAQRTMVTSFVGCDDCIVSEYKEVESGRNDNRPELLKALEHCKKEGAILVIAKLDRLARKVSFISALMESGVKFVCCDMPEATEFTIHIFAALAQQERKMISERTRKALDELKKKGVKLGKPENLTNEARMNAVKTNRNKALENPNNIKAASMIRLLKDKGHTLQEIANELNEKGFKTSQGKAFTRTQVSRLI